MNLLSNFLKFRLKNSLLNLQGITEVGSQVFITNDS